MKEYRRVLWVSCSVFALFALLVVQFFRVQIIQAEKWQKYAHSQHELIIKEPFKRGLFFANTSLNPDFKNKKQPLVVDIPKEHLFADSMQIPKSKQKEIVDKLADLLSLSSNEQEQFLKELSHEKSRSRKMKMWLSIEERNQLLRWWFPYARKNKIATNALFFVPDYKRSYHYGDLLGQVLHTIQENKEEQTKQGVPTGGLEYHFNSFLKGQEGKKKLMRSPKHALDQGVIIEQPVHGADVYLTINHHLQAIAEEEIEKGVRICGAKSGWALMMDPYTGEVLALAQYPKFSPENYKDYYQNEESIDHTRLKSVCDNYEPGSMFKPVTVAMCFLANESLKKQGKPPIFDPNEKVATSSGKFPGRSKDLQDPGHYRYLNMYLSMQKSTNIYLARMVGRIIKELGNEWYREQLCEVFELGKKTGIEYPLESPGFIPRPGFKNPNGTLEWSVPTPYSLAIGHNLMVNSMQMASIYCAFANGGYLVRPTFIKKISKTDENGKEEVLLDNTISERTAQFKRILSPYIADEVMKCLKYTIHNVRNGNGGNLADVYGYTVAGKSGTANKIVDGKYSKKNYFSSFVGIAPAQKPRFVLLVSMDEPQITLKHGIGYLYYGGKCAAPVFREIARRSFKYLGIAPDNPFHYPFGDPRRNVEKTFLYQETQELKKLNEKWN